MVSSVHADYTTAAAGEKDLCEPLEITIDYMLRFLEGDHSRSQRLAESDRGTVLSLVKSAMSWKTAQRPAKEVEKYTQNLNNVMSEIVRKL